MRTLANCYTLKWWKWCGKHKDNLNATFLLLIPKKLNAEEVKDFRPISLVDGVYKIIAKVLANRLRVVLSDIIWDSKCVYWWKSDLDLVIASECLDSRLKTGVPGVMCKLDMEKAYDHVNWNFLQYLLGWCGFSHSWQRWILSCVSIARFFCLD